MKIDIVSDYAAVSQHAAELILEVVRKKRHATLCLAAGHSPQRAYELVASYALRDGVDFSHVTFIALDEWVGIPPDDPGSCQYFLRKQVMKPLGVKEYNFHFFNAVAADLDSECIRMDERIAEHDGLDLMVLGIGMNGHLGFNEPGVPFDMNCHVTELDAVTETVGQKYFSETKKLHKGITVGLRHLMQARQVLLLADGVKKAAIVSQALTGNISHDMPASILRLHPNSHVILDQLAAGN